MSLRDLDISVEINSFDDELKAANEQCDELVNTVDEAGGSLDDMSAQGQLAGETTSESMDQATQSTGSLVNMLSEAGVQFDALAAAGALFLKSGITAQAEYQKAVESLRVTAGPDDFRVYMQGIRDEVERTHRFFTEGQMADFMRPIAASLRGNAPEVIGIIKLIDDRLIAMGADARTAQQVYMNLGAAITTGQATQLMRASMRLPVPIIQDPKAIEIANQMNKQLGVEANTMLLFKAIMADTSVKMRDVDHMLHLADTSFYRLHQTMGDFMEDVGRPYIGFAAEAADKTQRFLAALITGGWGSAVGRVTVLSTAVLGAVGAFKGLVFLLGKIGIEVTAGGIAAAGLTFLGWAAAAIGVALAVEDIWAAIEGRPSFVMDTFIPGLKGLPNLINSYVGVPIWNLLFRDLPHWLKWAGIKFAELFTVDVFNAFARMWNAILEIPGVGWAMSKLGAKEIALHEHSSISATSEDFWPEKPRAGFETQVIPEGNGEFTIWRNLPTAQPAKTEVTGKTADVISQINDQLNEVLFNQEQAEQAPIPAMDLGRSFAAEHELNLEPVQSAFSQVGHTFSINVEPGAIQVTGGDPEETANAIKDKLKNEIMLELESDLAGNLDKPVR